VLLNFTVERREVARGFLVAMLMDSYEFAAAARVIF
jgi:hypothetical protein